MARCLALVGMVAAHVVGEGRWSPVYDGRASALFAVLAGVSLALMTGRTTPRAPARTVAGLATRALLVAVLGLALGQLGTGIAVVLTYYGVLFVLGLPFLRLRAPTLFALAAGWALAGPVLSQLLRPHLPERRYASPALDQLAHPGHLAAELLLTGYYPAVPWLAYLLLGLALGRCDLGDRAVRLRVIAVGTVTAVAAFALSRALTREPWVLARVLGDERADPRELLEQVGGGMGGTTPSDTWAWLSVVAPHSGTPFDLLTTGAGAAAVIALCLLLTPPRGAAARVVQVAFGAGAMTLSLYSLHVVMRTGRVWPPEEASSYPWHLLVLLGTGAAFARARAPGPLDAAVKRAQRRVSGVPTRSPGTCP